MTRSKALIEELFDQPYEFDFFQAVQILERVDTTRIAIGGPGPPDREALRLVSLPSLNFPPSSIYSLEKAQRTPGRPMTPPRMTVAFAGMFGPDGALPTHYTESIIRLMERGRGEEKLALRDWLDLFNHRLISLFYRAWEKYRCTVPFVRYLRARALAEGGLPGTANTMQVSLALQAQRTEPDTFTLAMYNLIGLGPPSLRNRVQVAVRLATPIGDRADESIDKQRLAGIDDLAILYYSGLLAQRPRNANALAAIIGDLFGLPVTIVQFSGQWLDVPAAEQSSLAEDGNNELGFNVVAGERVWDVVSSFRICIGPLDLNAYQDLMPDRAPRPRRKAFFLLCQMVRLYVGPEFDFEVQLILKGSQVPECELAEGGRDVLGPRLGWNTWLRDGTMHDADDAFFQADDVCEIPAEIGAAA